MECPVSVCVESHANLSMHNIHVWMVKKYIRYRFFMGCLEISVINYFIQSEVAAFKLN